jgi:hypothetical protein
MKNMKNAQVVSLALAGLLGTWVFAAPAGSPNQAPTVPIPQAGVPQIFTIEGKFVRAAYNNEGYVIMGYQPANRSVGEEWMLLEVGITLREKKPRFVMKRDMLSVDTPDGKTIPLASTEEFRAANTQALQNRAKVQRDSIDYFPPNVHGTCRIGFFSDLGDRAMAWDQFEVSEDRACVGRIYFHIPGGIKYGQHWLNVKFPSGPVRAPFKILTDEEEKTFSKNYKSISNQVKEAFAPPKKEKKK